MATLALSSPRHTRLYSQRSAAALRHQHRPAGQQTARAMAFPHALRHALAVALLRGVTALDAKACLEWGYPKEGKWQHDDDCCAGVQQAACAAGYRYVKGCVLSLIHI
mgnify:CR=1 FL=1